MTEPVPAERMIQRVLDACRELHAEGMYGWTTGDLYWRKGRPNREFGATSGRKSMQVLAERGVLRRVGRYSITNYQPGPHFRDPEGTETL